MIRHLSGSLFVFICLLGMISFGQNQNAIDSLKDLLKTAKDTTEINLMNSLWEQYKKKGDQESMLLISKQAYKKVLQGNYYNKEADVLNYIAKTFMIGNMYDSSIFYSQKAILTGTRNKNIKSLSNTNTILGLTYMMTSQKELSIKYLRHALELRKEIGEKNFIADSYHNIGLSYQTYGDLDSSNKYEFLALDLRLKIGKKLPIALIYNNIGENYMYKGDYEKALQNMFKGLKYREEVGDKILIAHSYNSIGLIYQYLNQYRKALDYHLKALRYEEVLMNKVGAATSCGNIGSLYYNLKEYDKASEYYLRALKLFEELNDPANIALLWNNVGLNYYELKQYKKSLDYLFKAMAFHEKIGDKKSISSSYTGIASNYLKLKEFKMATDYFLKAEKISKETGQKDDLCQAFYNLSSVYGETKQYQNAYEKLQQFNSLKDSLYSIEKTKSITELEGKYNTSQKEKEILTLNYEKEKKQKQDLADKRQRQIVITAITIFLCLTALLSLVIFRNYRQKQKARIEAIEKEKIKADLNLLKNQISPHVMFNSLNTIYFQIDEDKENSKEMILQFADLLRYQLYECNVDFTNIANEISYMSKFVEIQRLRKSTRCKIDFKIDGNVKDFVIAPLLLIPLVENAFKYVTNDKNSENYISISLTKSGSKMEFTTENTMYADETSVDKKIHKGGIGLSNLKNRLDLIYPNKYELNINKENNIFKTKLIIYV